MSLPPHHRCQKLLITHLGHHHPGGHFSSLLFYLQEASCNYSLAPCDVRLPDGMAAWEEPDCPVAHGAQVWESLRVGFVDPLVRYSWVDRATTSARRYTPALDVFVALFY